MIDFSPSLGVDMLHNRLDFSINTNSNDSNLVAPSLTVVFKHLLVVSHGALARRTPSSPEINEHYLARLMINTYWV